MFKKNTIIKTPLFHDSEEKLFYVRVVDSSLCEILPQDKISEALEYKIFMYSEEESFAGIEDYKETYPQHVL
jgi:hypothetical protein